MPVTLVDTSQASIDKGLKFAGEHRFLIYTGSLLTKFTDKLLEKDVAKERISKDDATATRGRLTTTTKMDDLSEVDMVIEAVPVRASLLSIKDDN